MQQIIPLYGLALLAGAFFTACSSELPEDMPAETEQTASVSFQISRAAEAGDADRSLRRLYAAARSLDHASASDGGLYSDPDLRPFATSNPFQVNGLKLQWYKFSLVQVPHLVGNDGTLDGRQLFSDLRSDASAEEKLTRDFSGLLIDYTDVLKLQEQDHASSLNYDLHLYRAVVSRWMTRQEEGKEAPQQHLKLKRITGQLELNMGILPDQFEHRVKKIVIRARLPRRVYISDSQLEDGAGEVKVDNTTQIMRSYEYQVPDVQSNPAATDTCKLTMALLPCQLDATLRVYCTTQDGREEVQEFTLQSESSQAAVQIKPNVRTTVLFNGMYRHEFEVRYAGFPGSGIDVDEDEWNGGWPENGTVIS